MTRSVFVSLAIFALARPAPPPVPRPASPPSREHAAWGPDSVLTLGGGSYIPLSWGVILSVPKGEGDLYAIWHFPGSSSSISRVSRVTRDGGLVFSAYQDYRTGPQGIALDGSGGVLEAFTPQGEYSGYYWDIGFRRTTPAGIGSPYYLAHRTTPLAPETFPAAALDPNGGAYIAWSRGSGPYFLQRVTAAGTIAPGWSSAGRRMVPPDGFVHPIANPSLLPDGSGGVFMLAASDLMRVWRVNSDTTLASGWPSFGVALSTVADSYAGGADPSDVALVAGPAGHTFAVWLEYDATFTNSRVAVRSFDGAGNLDGPVLGLSPFTSNTITSLAAQEDGQGGMLVTWNQGGTYTLEIARVLANGAVGAGPIRVADHALGGAVATGRNGGFLVFWGDDLAGMWGQWYLAGGTPDPNELVNPRLLRARDTPALFYPLAAYTDGNGGAYLLFNNGGHPYPTLAQMMHVFPSGVLDKGASALDAGLPPRGSGLALAVTPNPARGELRLGVTLLGEQAACIDLLDIAGRRLLTRTLPTGASVREERVALPSELPSGVYLVRLRQGSRAALQRVAIIQ